jgi:hypothetical protein
MKIRELVETEFSSNDDTDVAEKYLRIYEGAIEYFDDYIERYGTQGANIEFTHNINKTKGEFIDFVLKSYPSYHAMIDARNRLEEKIKNSNGISY